MRTIGRCVCPGILALLFALPAAGAETVEIKGRITNPFTEEQYRSVTILITDRLGTVIGQTRPGKNGEYAIKISAPQFVIIKADLEGYPTALCQLDTIQHKESSDDREHNVIFGELRVPTYHQNITFGAKGSALSLDELLAKEDPKAVGDYQSIRKLKEQGDLKKAISSLEKLNKKYPSFYIGLIDLGMMLAAQQDNDRALGIFTQANKLRPEHSWAYVGLGLTLNNKQDFKGAVEPLEKAVAMEPDSINAQFQLGLALFRLNDSDRALACLQRVVHLDPKFNPMAYKYMSSIYIKKPDPEGAAHALKAYLEHFPDASDRDRVEQILKKLGS